MGGDLALKGESTRLTSDNFYRSPKRRILSTGGAPRVERAMALTALRLEGKRVGGEGSDASMDPTGVARPPSLLTSWFFRL